ncbi:cysteine hydrolase family protein [Leifsonia sp. A12D58]|uniref:cysteine hydrolase family protein n=1 Tax=Leifsonia sp. A12D58 TaxID=3397674 RepID=UPI0039E10898
MSRFVDRTKTAVLVIDLQVDVIAGCFDGQGVLERTEALIARARASAVPVIFVQHEEPGLERGSDAWQLAAPLVPQGGEALVFKKYRDSFVDTTLAAVLAEAKVSRLVIAGAQSDYCVRTTAQRAAAEGYDIVLVGDCHTTTDSVFNGVPLSGEQIVAHTAQYFAGLAYPGQASGLEMHDRVALS